MCPRRRFYRGALESVAAGKKERVLFHKGKICVRQLNIYCNGDDTTGTYKNKWIIKVDGEELVNMNCKDMYKYLVGYIVCQHANRPVINTIYNDSSKIYAFIINDLGVVNEGIEVWFENKDTSNSCGIVVGMVYDVLE